jgi:hypothetical protein
VRAHLLLLVPEDLQLLKCPLRLKVAALLLALDPVLLQDAKELQNLCRVTKEG